MCGDRGGGQFCTQRAPGVSVVEAIDLEVVVSRVQATPASDPQVIPPLSLKSPWIK